MKKPVPLHPDIFGASARTLLLWWGMIGLGIIAGYRFLPVIPGFLGSLPLSHFDGVHYVSIAQHNYFQYQQAFFPVYPLFIEFLHTLFRLPRAWAGLILSNASFAIALVVWRQVLMLRYGPVFRNVLPYFLVYPASFFFASVYSESLFFLFAAMTMYFVLTKRYWLAGLAGALASGTRLFGVFLVPYAIFEYLRISKSVRTRDLLALATGCFGLAAYMAYSYGTTGDALAFFHVQPAFGAGRSGGEIIFLPQVLYRYARIFLTVSWQSREFWVAGWETVSFVLAVSLLGYGWKRRLLTIGESVYVLSIIILPTLTGTLSSMPRYVLSAFPLFFVMANVHNMGIRRLYLLVSVPVLIICTAAFNQGYFVS